MRLLPGPASTPSCSGHSVQTIRSSCNIKPSPSTQYNRISATERLSREFPLRCYGAVPEESPIHNLADRQAAGWAAVMARVRLGLAGPGWVMEARPWGLCADLHPALHHDVLPRSHPTIAGIPETEPSPASPQAMSLGVESLQWDAD